MELQSRLIMLMIINSIKAVWDTREHEQTLKVQHFCHVGSSFPHIGPCSTDDVGQSPKHSNKDSDLQIKQKSSGPIKEKRST